jgi:aspartyl-tRNA(Asn)/glutamyl-tRNA(Gln) amidotransferase subunit A
MARALHHLTIAEASRLIRSRQLSPVDLTQAYLDRIRMFDGRLNAFILLMEQSALTDAAKADREIAAGGWKGPLHGIPIGLKDIYNTAGVATTGHSALFKDHVPTEDATTVRKLRDAGAVIIGKLSTMEFAIGGPSFDLPWPPTKNPWKDNYDPSGSSSGSGVAIAAGFCTGSMGTDTGGSIRGPSAWCGVAGLKPTYGLVSRRGILPLSFTLDHGGPMCWTSEDCALMMQVLSGHDALDPGSADVPVPDFTGAIGSGIKGLRVGVIRHYFEKEVATDAETVAALEEAIRVTSRMGAVVSDVRMAPAQTYHDVSNLIMAPEAYAIHERYLTKTPELYGELARRRIMMGAFVRSSDYVNALRERSRLAAHAAAVMQDVDVLITPTRGFPAVELGSFDFMKAGISFTRPYNVLGYPALSVCCGFSASGLPLSMQIAGRPFEDHTVLKLGDAYEKATGFRERRPELEAVLETAA